MMPDQTSRDAGTGGDRPRVILLAGPHTYRAESFLAAAAKLGIEVVQGLDLPGELAERWRVELALDYADVPGSVARIERYAASHPVAAILSVDDGATLLAAEASRRLGLRHNSPEAALAARDKGVMRDTLAGGGLRVPWYRRFPLAGDPDSISRQVPYPCVVKPLRLSGSRGVIRADGPEQLVAAHGRLLSILASDGYAPERTEFLVEGFVPGFEVALEGMLSDGRLRVLALFDKPDPLDGPFFEETIYVTPSRLPEEAQRSVEETAAEAARALGLRQGPVHAELRVNDEGAWLIEMAGRSIGGLCSSVLRFGTDACLEELILRNACGLPTEGAEREATAAGVMMIPISGRGLLTGVEGIEEAREVPHVEDVQITAPLNQPLVPLPEGSSYLGFIFSRAGDPETAERALREAHSRLRFTLRPYFPVSSV